MKRGRGATLVELLVACGAFLIIGVMVSYAMVNGFRQTRFQDGKSETLQGLFLFRDRLHKAMGNGLLEVHRSAPGELVYLMPATVSSSIGDVHALSPSELTRWDTEGIHRVTLLNQVGQNKLLHTVTRNGNLTEQKVWWDLGSLGADFQCDYTQLPVLRIEVGGQEREESPPWRREFFFVVAHHRQL